MQRLLGWAVEAGPGRGGLLHSSSRAPEVTGGLGVRGPGGSVPVKETAVTVSAVFSFLLARTS